MTDVNTNILFYIFTAAALLGVLSAVFSKRTMSCVISAVVVFWSLSGLYFLLELYYLAAVQILIYGVAIAILLAFCVMLTDKSQDLKTWFKADFKMFASVALLALLGLLFLPFVQNAFAARNEFFSFSLKSFALEFFPSAFLPFELVSVLLLVALIGVAAIVHRRKGR